LTTQQVLPEIQAAPEALTIKAALEMSSLLAKTSPMITETPQLDVSILLCHVLSVDATYLRTWPDKVLTQAQVALFLSLVQQRLSGQPIAHIVGSRGFWSLNLQVNASTLIPRPDTECLVEHILECFDEQARPVLDLGTGTGAIALSLAAERPRWSILATDFNEGAVALAEENRLSHGLSNVSIAQGSWFEAVPAEQTFALIVSNPPYIDPADKHLQQGDVRFEPLTALIADSKGMADIEHIISCAPDYLISKGVLVLEHGYDQANAVRACMCELGFTQVESFKDYGGNDRFTTGMWMHDEL